MEHNEQFSIVKFRRVSFFDVRHSNGHLIAKTFDRAQADRLKAAFDAEHPDSPCLIQEQSAVVMPEPLYISKRGKLHFKKLCDPMLAIEQELLQLSDEDFDKLSD